MYSIYDFTWYKGTFLAISFNTVELPLVSDTKYYKRCREER